MFAYDKLLLIWHYLYSCFLQFSVKSTRDTTTGVGMYTDTASFEAKRNEVLQRQRELEKRRNQEDDYMVKTQRWVFIM